MLIPSIRRDSVVLPVLALVASIFALALGTSMAKQLFPVIGAQGTSALRVGLAAAVLLLLLRPWRRPLSRIDAAVLLRYGLALGLMNLCFYMAIRTIPFGVAVAIEFTGPLAVALYFSRRKWDYLWVILALVGLLLVLPVTGAASALDPVGVAYAIAAAVFWGTYIVFGKRAGHLPAMQSVSIGLLMAALVVVPIGVAHAGAQLLQPSVLLWGLGIAIVSSAIPISLEMFALKRLPRETFGILTSLEPAMAALSGMLFLHEMLTVQQWLAIACIMAAALGSVVAVESKKMVSSDGVTG